MIRCSVVSSRQMGSSPGRAHRYRRAFIAQRWRTHCASRRAPCRRRSASRLAAAGISRVAGNRRTLRGLAATGRGSAGLRKPAVAVFTLDDYVAAGIMRAGQAETLRTAVADRRNVLVAGGTSTGKTTLTNALL